MFVQLNAPVINSLLLYILLKYPSLKLCHVMKIHAFLGLIIKFIRFAARTRRAAGQVKKNKKTPAIWVWGCSFEERQNAGWKWEDGNPPSVKAIWRHKKNASVFDFFWWPLSESHFPTEAHHCSSSLWSEESKDTRTQTHTVNILYMC